MNLFKIFSSKVFSKDIASDRLKLILIHDRAEFEPDFLEMIKCDILKVISKYAEIETGDIELGNDWNCLRIIKVFSPIN